MLAVPESTYCSAQTTSPLPAQSRSTPASARVPQSARRVGSASFLKSSATPPSRSPAVTKRTPAMRNGGSDSTPTRMAR
jgi:hypothetical protein